MGCGESKIKRINLTPDQADHNDVISSSNGEVVSNDTTSTGIRPKSVLIDGDEGLPNRLLAAIPISDLGESLDSRHLGESLNAAASQQILASGKNGGADSADSTDSGYDEYEEEYSHIITESSAPDLVKQVEAEFKPVELPELLVITGRACTRILSGYQKTKAEEAKILDSLRDEGLLAKPKGKTAGGLSFEVVDAAVVEKKSYADNRGGDAFISSEFIPSRTLKKLELRRGVRTNESLIIVLYCKPLFFEMHSMQTLQG